MSPRLSIVVPTMRVGGLDVLWAGLERQTCRDFELVLVDDLKWVRKQFIRPRPEQYAWLTEGPIVHEVRGVEFLYLEPIGGGFPNSHYCRSVNTGIRAARGDVVAILSDYTLLPPNYVETHLRLHDERHDRVVLSPHVSWRCPPVKSKVNYRPNLDHYTSEGLDRYCTDLEMRALDDCMWSIFEQPFDPDTIIPHGSPEERFGSDPKENLPPGPLANIQLFFCRGESVKREHLLAINGFDEALDGSHGYQDSDLVERLYRMGVEFWNAPEATCTIINPRPYFPHARRERPIESNGAYFNARLAAGFPGTVRGVRELCREVFPLDPRWGSVSQT